MLNQSIIVGRLVNDPELRETENGHKVVNVMLAVPRSYRNSEGEYDTDFIKCVLWRGVAERTSEYCRKGDLIGVRGRIQTRDIEQEDESIKTITEVVAEKVTFLQTQNFKNQTNQ